MQRLSLYNHAPRRAIRLSAVSAQAVSHLLQALRSVGHSPYVLPGTAVAGFVGLACSGPLGAIALVSLGAGIGVYLHQVDRLYIRWLPWRRWWRPANRPLTRALLSGGGVAGAGLLLLNVWQRSPWPGLVTLAMAQTLMLAALALRQTRSPHQVNADRTRVPVQAKAVNQGKSDSGELDALLTALAADHPIQQLVAIRQALRWLSATEDATDDAAAEDSGATEAIATGFTLLLRRTRDPEIRRFLERGLAQIQPDRRPLEQATRYEAASAPPVQFALEPALASRPVVSRPIPSTPMTIPTDR